MGLIEDEIANVQPVSYANVFLETNQSSPYSPPAVIDQLKSYDEDSLRNMLGETSQKIISFINYVDIYHPDVAAIIPKEGAEYLSQILSVSEFAHKKSLHLMLPNIRSIAAREIKENLRWLDDPNRNLQLTRMVKSSELRKELRQNKSFRKITLEAFHRENRGNWDHVPSTSKLLSRFSDGRQEEIDKAEKMLARYKTLGCQSLQEEIEKSISEYKAKISDNYLGFKRVLLTEMAVILAKLHGCNYLASTDGLKIKFPASRFPFRLDVEREAGSVKFTNFGWVDKDNNQTDHDYTPRVYTYDEISNIASPEMKKVVAHLEALPELGKRPAFDYYMVVVPSVEYPTGLSLKYTYTNHLGVVNQYSHHDEAQSAFDLDLMLSKKVLPALVAERDGKCYFICYFQ
jgi:hypothetical protein